MVHVFCSIAHGYLLVQAHLESVEGRAPHFCEVLRGFVGLDCLVEEAHVDQDVPLRLQDTVRDHVCIHGEFCPTDEVKEVLENLHQNFYHFLLLNLIVFYVLFGYTTLHPTIAFLVMFEHLAVSIAGCLLELDQFIDFVNN